MSEISDLVVVLGELDRELARLAVDDPDRAEAARAAAATLIPPLGDPATVGWYDRFIEVTGFDPPTTDLDRALVALQRGTTSAATLPRRLIAVGAVTRALDAFKPGNEHQDAAQVALSGPGILRTAPGIFDSPDELVGPREGAEVLHERLLDVDTLPDLRAYRTFVEALVADGLVHEDLAAAPAPCTTVLVPVHTASGRQVALGLTTNVCVSGVTFDEATEERAFLNPANWAGYSHWCGMTPEGGNPPPDWRATCRFLEHVALDCPSGLLAVSVWLDFSSLRVAGDVAYREYHMTADVDLPAQPQGNGAVSIDEGVVCVRREADHLRVTTTKRVEFTFGIEEPALAVLSCAVGYGALAADFVVGAFRGGGGGGPRVREEACAATTVERSRNGSGAAVDPLDEPVAALAATADDCIAASRAAFARAARGGTTLPSLAGDLADSLVRGVTAATQLVAIAAVIADPPAVQGHVVSDEFSVTGAGPASSGPFRLALTGPLSSLRGEQLPESLVELRPPELASGADRFTLVVRADGLGSGAYLGAVLATDVATGQARRVSVDVLVP